MRLPERYRNIFRNTASSRISLLFLGMEELSEDDRMVVARGQKDPEISVSAFPCG